MYDIEAALKYAKTWALGRNPVYYNFDNYSLGGDCTNFVSQCLFAGCKVMNFKKDLGWYYKGLNDRAPAWTGVKYFYNFLTSNKGVGPFGHEAPMFLAAAGDYIQLSFNGIDYTHSLIVVQNESIAVPENIFVAAHSYDAYMKPLNQYYFQKARLIKIDGVNY